MSENYLEIDSISSGIVNSVIRIIDKIDKAGGQLSYKDFEILISLTIVSRESVLGFSYFLSCFKIEQEIVYLSPDFKDLDNEIEIYRRINEFFLLKVRPVWIDRLKWGLASVAESMDENTRHCFLESGLLQFNDLSVLKWWYSLPYYGGDVNNMIIGAIGELLTVNYEENERGWNAEVVSLRSSSKGYDILSIDQEDKCFIEAKTSQNGSFIFITRNEWDKSKSLSPYFFYIWKLNGEMADLYIMSPSQLTEHVPEKSISGIGEFEICKLDLNELLAGYSKSFQCNFRINSKNKLEIY